MTYIRDCGEFRMAVTLTPTYGVAVFLRRTWDGSLIVLEIVTITIGGQHGP